MIAALLDAWLSRDLPYSEIWDLTPREIAVIIEGKDKAILADHEARRILAHEQAVLIHFATLNPKKMPKYEPLKKGGKLSNEVQTEMVRAWFMSKVH